MTGRHADPADDARRRETAVWLTAAACLLALLSIGTITAVVVAGAGTPGRPPVDVAVPAGSPAPPAALPGSAPPTSTTGATPAPDATPPGTPRPGPSTGKPEPDRTTARPDPTTARPDPTVPEDSGMSRYEEKVLNLVNQERAEVGCRPLDADPKLARAARSHSADMATQGYFAHDTPDGTDPGKRITAAGYRWSAWGENIAKGQPDPESVMRAWMNSPGHRANILNCGFRDLGVGLAYGSGHTPYWTQDFGTPR